MAPTPRRRWALAVALVALLTGSALVGLGPGAHARGPSLAPDGAALPTVPTTLTVPAYVPTAGVTDLGSAPGSTPWSFEVGLVSQDPAGLDRYVAASEIPGTSLYHRFLSAASAAARFGATASAVSAAESYFHGFGLAVRGHPDGLLLSVSGTVAQAGAALGTTFDVYRNPAGTEFLDHPSPARLPPVAPWSGILGVGNLSQFAPEVSASPLRAPVPAVGCGPAGTFLTPCEVATAYDYAGLNANGTNGSGIRIAVIDAYSSRAKQTALAADFSTFTTAEGLPHGNLSFYYPVATTRNLNASGTNPPWALENELDIEWSRAAAPGATIEMVFSPNGGADLYYAIDWVVATKAADVLSMSWGEPEVGVFNASYAACTSACNASSDGTLAVLEPILELGAAEGITSFSASGDCGSADGTSGVAANYPASSPFVTGVGATALTIDSAGRYVSESAWRGNSSGAFAPGCINQGGSGGGFSVFPRPAWQTGNGTASGRGRGVPDVSIVGAASSPVAINSGNEGVYGTSVGSPIWAGITATADQAAGGDLGLINPGLYRVLAGGHYARDLHDITTGSNGYHAGVGWDAVTGVGTPNVAQLLPDLSAGTVAPSSLGTYVYAAPRFGLGPLNVSFTSTTHGGSGSYPIVGVAFGDGTSGGVLAGHASHVYAHPGVYSASTYVVDSTGSVAVSPPVVVVVGGGSWLAANLTVSNPSPARGVAVTFSANVSGGTPPYSYNFSFGDGLRAVNGSSAAIVHAYSGVGGYCAEVTVRDGASPEDGGASARVAVAVGGASSPSCGNAAAPIQLTPLSTVPIRDAPADFPSLFTISGGSGSPGGLAPQLSLRSADPYTAACDCAIFRSAGNYSVLGQVYDTVRGAASARTNVTVAPELNASFAASTLSGTVPLHVRFTASSSGGYQASAANTRWSFGNGGGAIGASTTAVYSSPGEYVAIASLGDAGNGNASEAFFIDARASSSSAVGIVGTVSPAVNVSAGTTVVWNATALGPIGTLAGSVVSWELGNGAYAFGPWANETYFPSTDLLPGDTLAAAVSVVSPSQTTLVRVAITLPGFFATESGGFVPSVDALSLRSQVSPVSGVTPLQVNATARASGPGGTAVGWLWGDGGSAVGSPVSHLYFAVGAFTVVARAYDAFNDVADRLAGVQTNPALTLAGCLVPTLHGDAPFTVHLAAGAYGGAGAPYGYAWSLPSGGSSAASNVTLTFAGGGTFHVSVAVTDAASATAVCSWTIVVTGHPPVSALYVVVLGVLSGAALAVVFLYATRPRKAS